MAFVVGKNTDRISVIARCDDAIDTENYTDESFKEVYSKYLEDLDESKLSFIDGKSPTRFILKKNLNLKEHLKIQNDRVKISGKEIMVQMGYIVEEVRLALVGIDNPPGISDALEYKQDGSGGASLDLMEKLANAGIIEDLHNALTFSRSSKSINKKK